MARANIRNRVCSVDDCGSPILAKGLCRKHYLRNRKHGTTDKTNAVRVIAVGDIFGALTTVSKIAASARSKWICRCECGKTVEVFSDNLVRGHSASCGCRAASIHTTHGKSRTKEYRAWLGMRTRCTLPNTPYFKHYGGRGIKVCERWDSFDLFLADMGPRPTPHHSIDRIDVNGNYEPTNCRWADKTVQSRNTRRQHYVTVGGERVTLAEAVEGTKLNYSTVLHRILRGWEPETAIQTPARGSLK